MEISLKLMNLKCRSFQAFRTFETLPSFTVLRFTLSSFSKLFVSFVVETSKSEPRIEIRSIKFRKTLEEIEAKQENK